MLQPLTLPLAPERSRPLWSSRALWSHERAWLHTLTPYGGGAGGAKSTGYTGFYSAGGIQEAPADTQRQRGALHTERS